MSRLQGWLVVALLCFVIYCQWTHPGSSPAWQYQIVSASDDKMEETLTMAGFLRWELVVARRGIDGKTAGYEMIFKRRR